VSDIPNDAPVFAIRPIVPAWWVGAGVPVGHHARALLMLALEVSMNVELDLTILISFLSGIDDVLVRDRVARIQIESHLERVQRLSAVAERVRMRKRAGLVVEMCLAELIPRLDVSGVASDHLLSEVTSTWELPVCVGDVVLDQRPQPKRKLLTVRLGLTGEGAAFRGIAASCPPSIDIAQLDVRQGERGVEVDGALQVCLGRIELFCSTLGLVSPVRVTSWVQSELGNQDQNKVNRRS